MDGTGRWFDHLARSLAKGVRRVSRGGSHRYRRFHYLGAAQAGIAGAAGWDGTLLVHPEVPPFLKQLFDDRGRGWSEKDLVEAVSNLGTLIHESFHHLVPRDANVVRDQWAYGTFVGVALEEGVTEAATQWLLPRVVRRMEASVHGLSRGLRSRESVYWNYVPAVQELVRGLKALPGMGGHDVLMELARESPATKLEVLTRLYLEGLGLDRRLSERGRHECQVRMGKAVRRLYEAPETRAWAEPPDPRYPSRVNSADPVGRSTILGMQVLVELEWESRMAQERDGLPMGENWRIEMAERAVEVAREAIRRSARRPQETRDAAQAWLDQAVEDHALATAPPPAIAETHLGSRVASRADLWIRSRMRWHRERRRQATPPTVWGRGLG
ncbi:MAG: hypothetical protein J2P38_01155 [Candidatus Dormibacteraeota bacterium]|nr:hypothetical protein [Candidatus Dormibacteraeota bacterium]